MKLLRLKGGQSYFITDEEADNIADTITKKGVAFLGRLENLMVSEFLIEGLGPVNQDFVGKEIFADAHGILYYNDGIDWYFWHLLPALEKGQSYSSAVSIENGRVADKTKRVFPDNETILELKNRIWTKVGEHDAVAIIPADEYLKLKFTNNPVLNSIKDVKLLADNDRNLPAVISSELKLIGVDDLLARYKQMENGFNDRSLQESVMAYYRLVYMHDREFDQEFKDIFLDKYKVRIEDCKL